jgi:hypothetical protein
VAPLGVKGILFSEALVEEGAVVFAKACELGLEGIVSKRAGSFYKSGRSRNWLNTKNPGFVRWDCPNAFSRRKGHHRSADRNRRRQSLHSAMDSVTPRP